MALVGSARRGAVVIVMLGILLVFTGCSGETGSSGEAEGGGQQSEQSQGESNPEAQPSEDTGQEEQQAQEETETASIGEEVSVGDVSYTVTDAERVSQLEDPYGLDEPLTGNFMLVSFTFTNNGSDPATVSDIGMYLYDEEGNQYETDSDAALYLPEDTSMFMLDRVNPGLSQEVQTLYEIPPNAEGFELEVTSGLLATETAHIDLESTQTNTDTSDSTSGGSSEAALLQSFVDEYYAYVGAEDWQGTYSMLDEQTQSLWTEAEWIVAQTAWEDQNGNPPAISRVVTNVYGEDPAYAIDIQINRTDGQVNTVYKEVSYEDGEYKRHFTDEELASLEPFRP
ncbi:hypothetical protein BH20ACT11_BH20ACT11_08800 [soil metagenome]